MKLEFSQLANRALKLMEKSERNILLTGKAGTGKSTLLEHFKENTKKKCAILAPTGVAALNVNGETIHSFFGLKPGFELDEVIEKFHTKRKSFFQNLEMIIIDEISMVRADVLDAIDIFLKKARDSFAPFGDVQMVFIGDLCQLPPVITKYDKDAFYERYSTPFFFGANAFTEGHFDMEFIELDEIYRQNDERFISILNDIRDKSISNEALQKLNARVDPNFEEDEDFIHLMTTNANAKKLNEIRLNELNEEEVFFDAEIVGEVEKNQFPTDEELKLKVGAQVMFVNNCSTRQWVNGTIGKITDIDIMSDVLTVELTDGSSVEVSPNTWDISKYVFENNKFERKMIGSFTQIPLKLAWAITIHKSQGKTFEKTVIDLGYGSFAHGQTYVALSRCTSLEGIVLKKPVRHSDIKSDRQVQQFLRNYRALKGEF